MATTWQVGRRWSLLLRHVSSNPWNSKKNCSSPASTVTAADLNGSLPRVIRTITSCGYRSEDPTDQSQVGSKDMIRGTRAAISDDSTDPIRHRSIIWSRGAESDSETLDGPGSLLQLVHCVGV